MKKGLVILALCFIIPAQAFAELEITVTGGMEATFMFQSINYQEMDDRLPPVKNPLWVSGFGRDGSDLPMFHIGLSANYSGLVGFDGNLEIFPPWNDTRVTGDFEGVPVRAVLDVQLARMAGWFQPFPWLKTTAGIFELNTLTGKLGGFGWGSYLGVRAGGSDGIFTRFEGTNAVALEFINPIGHFVQDNPWLDGLYFGAMLYDIYIARSANNGGVNGGVQETKFIFENLQLALGYEIQDVGLFRAQYIGVHPMANARRITDSDNNDDNGGPRSQLAFTFTMIPNLTMEIGGTISHLVTNPINRIPALTVDGQYQTELVALEGEYLNHHRIGGVAEYDFNDMLGQALTVRAGIEFNWGGYSAPVGSGRTDFGTVTKIWLSPVYRLGNVNLGIDFGLNILGDEHYFERLYKRGGYRYGFGAYAGWNPFGDCLLQFGIAFANGEALGTDRVEPRYLDRVLTFPFLFKLSF